MHRLSSLSPDSSCSWKSRIQHVLDSSRREWRSHQVCSSPCRVSRLRAGDSFPSLASPRPPGFRRRWVFQIPVIYSLQRSSARFELTFLWFLFIISAEHLLRMDPKEDGEGFFIALFVRKCNANRSNKAISRKRTPAKRTPSLPFKRMLLYNAMSMPKNSRKRSEPCGEPKL